MTKIFVAFHQQKLYFTKKYTEESFLQHKPAWKGLEVVMFSSRLLIIAKA
jgi:hypothetical protein